MGRILYIYTKKYQQKSPALPTIFGCITTPVFATKMTEQSSHSSTNRSKRNKEQKETKNNE